MKAFWFLLATALVMVLLLLPLRLIGSHPPREEPRPGEYRLAEALRLAERDGKCVIVFIEPGSALLDEQDEGDDADDRPRPSAAMLRARDMVIEDEIFSDPQLRDWIDRHALFVRSGTLSRAEALRLQSLIGAEHRPHDLWVLGGKAPPRQAPALERSYLVEFFEAARTGEPAADAWASWRARFKEWSHQRDRLYADVGYPLDEAAAGRYVELWRELNHGDLNSTTDAEIVSVLRRDLRDNPFLISAFEELREEFMARYEAGSLADGLRWASVTVVELEREEEAAAFAIRAAEQDWGEEGPDPSFMAELVGLADAGVIDAGRPELAAKWRRFDLIEVSSVVKSHDSSRRHYLKRLEYERKRREMDPEFYEIYGSRLDSIEEWHNTIEMRRSARLLAGLHAGYLMIGETENAQTLLDMLSESPEGGPVIAEAIAMAAEHAALHEMHLPHLDPDDPEHAAWIKEILIREP